MDVCSTSLFVSMFVCLFVCFVWFLLFLVFFYCFLFFSFLFVLFFGWVFKQKRSKRLIKQLLQVSCIQLKQSLSIQRHPYIRWQVNSLKGIERQARRLVNFNRTTSHACRRTFIGIHVCSLGLLPADNVVSCMLHKIISELLNTPFPGCMILSPRTRVKCLLLLPGHPIQNKQFHSNTPSSSVVQSKFYLFISHFILLMFTNY